MFKKALGTICVVVLGIGVCLAQSNDSQTVTNWGVNVQGVQLTILMTNGVVETGSTIALTTVIKNSSTNVIQLGQTWQPADYDIFLMSGSGKTYHLTQPPLIVRMNTTLTINPGEQNIRNITATVGKSIEAGNYTLQATRNFYIGESQFKLESNLLKVQIK